MNVEAARRFRLKSLIAKTYQSFGFQPIETSALENLNILVGTGGGEENEKLIFKVLKRGEKLKESLTKPNVQENDLTDFGMRFDLTLPLSRVVANARNEISFPWKVFQMGPVWRAERAQKGRFREFTQCDVDIIGSSHRSAEMEVIQAVTHAISGLHGVAGAGSKDFELRMNDRRILSGLAEQAGLKDKSAASFAILLDKKDKVSAEELEAELKTLVSSSGKLDLALKALSGELTLKDAKSFAEEAASHLSLLIGELELMNLPISRVVFDPSLARGLGYYTGTIYELRHASAGYSIGGGGRYDQLIGRFSKQTYPAVGFSIGFDRLLLLLEETEKASASGDESTIFFPVMDEKLRMAVLDLAKSVRQSGRAIDVYPEEAKLKTQLKFAEDKGYRWIVIAGETEFQNKKFNLKDFKNRSEVCFDLQGILNHLK